MSENGEIYTTGKNFTLPPALTAWTNSTSVLHVNTILLIFGHLMSLKTILNCLKIYLNLKLYDW